MTHLRIVREWTPKDGHRAIADAIAGAASLAEWVEALKTGLEAASKWLAAHTPDSRPAALLPPSGPGLGAFLQVPPPQVQADREPWRRGRQAPRIRERSRDRQRRLK